MDFLSILFFWLVFSLAAAAIASNKGRSGIGVFIISIILSPMVGLIVALVSKSAKRIREEAAERGDSPDYRKCPYCAEIVRREAVKCRQAAG